MDPEEKAVCCFRAGSHQSHLTLNYTQGDGVYEYDENPEKHSAKKCICSFLQNVSSSNAGTYFCAVATCGEIFSRNGSKLDTEGNCIYLRYGEISRFGCLKKVLKVFSLLNVML